MRGGVVAQRSLSNGRVALATTIASLLWLVSGLAIGLLRWWSRPGAVLDVVEGPTVAVTAWAPDPGPQADDGS